jgi:RNA recognition motif-containing protein
MLEYFKAYGDVEECTIMRDKFTGIYYHLSKDHYVGKSRGFGFIVMKGLVAVEAILANRDEHFLAGKKVLIFNFAFFYK